MDWVGEAARCAEMRRITANIVGFSELLADPLLPMERRQELKYLEIVVAAGLAWQPTEYWKLPTTSP
jgi:hypothetical protein